MIAYPNIPQPSQTFSGETSTPVVRSDLPMGLVQQEGRFATARRSYKVLWVFDAAQLATFETWFTETLADGVLLFWLPLHTSGGVADTPVRFVNGEYTVAGTNGTKFQVSAMVERMTVENAHPNRTLPVPIFTRLLLDVDTSQQLSLHHRNSQLSMLPEEGNTLALRIPPPLGESSYIPFGVVNLGLGDTLITSEGEDPLPTTTISTFPANLPRPEAQERRSVRHAKARLDMDSGHPRQWSQSDVGTESYVLSWCLTLDEMTSFRLFFFDDLLSGSLPFYLYAPFGGVWQTRKVRFDGGSYAERFNPDGTFTVILDATLVLNQSVVPSDERAYPVYYTPEYTPLVPKYLVAAEDAGKMFVLAPALGETVSLHIADQEIEFGVRVEGLGNVLITREGIQTVVEATHNAGIVPFATFMVKDILLDIGTMPPFSAGVAAQKPTFALVSVVRDIGIMPPASAGVAAQPIVAEVKEVLEDIGVFTDAAGVTTQKPTFVIDTP